VLGFFFSFLSPIKTERRELFKLGIFREIRFEKIRNIVSGIRAQSDKSKLTVQYIMLDTASAITLFIRV